RDLSASYFHVGLVHQMRGERDDAARAFARAGELAQKAGDPIELSSTLRHQADLAEKRGDLDGARALHARSLALREQAGVTLGIANAHVSLAHLEPAKAQAHLARAVELSVSIGDELTLGEAELAWAELSHSAVHARRALESARRTHDVETERAAARLAAAP